MKTKYVLVAEMPDYYKATHQKISESLALNLPDSFKIPKMEPHMTLFQPGILKEGRNVQDFSQMMFRMYNASKMLCLNVTGWNYFNEGANVHIYRSVDVSNAVYHRLWEFQQLAVQYFEPKGPVHDLHLHQTLGSCPKKVLDAYRLNIANIINIGAGIPTDLTRIDRLVLYKKDESDTAWCIYRAF